MEIELIVEIYSQRERQYVELTQAIFYTADDLVMQIARASAGIF